MTATDLYLDYAKARQTELQDIAAMDRLAAELRPPSALQRWAQQRRSGQTHTSVRGRVHRLLGAGRTHHA